MEEKTTGEAKESTTETVKLDDQTLASIIKEVTSNLLEAQKASPKGKGKAKVGESSGTVAKDLGKFPFS